MKKYLLLYLLIACAFPGGAQTSYLPLHVEEYHMLDRLEALSGVLTDDFHTTLKPIARKGAVNFLKKQRQEFLFQSTTLSKVDAFNIQRALSISGEWSETAEGDDGAIVSRRPVLKYFYQKQPDLIHVSTDDFFLVVNPVLYAQGMKERNSDGLKYINTRGAEIRGRIAGKVGFYTLLADNQEKTISYIEDWANGHSAFPGADYYSRPGSGSFDYLMARGYVDVGAFNDHLNVTFGFDKQFSGTGIRSLLLSDFSSPATFLRLRTQWGKLVYENLYLELIQDYNRLSDRRLPKKYAAIHQLSMNVTPWLNIGIFESTLFGRPDQFRADYLVPVLFYNTLARSLGASQKTALGLNFKAIALHTLQIYGQAFADQYKPGQASGWWGNQVGGQLGLQYFNAFTLPNLDIQAEWNAVRPFTYAANDGVTDYTHYNQPLAHPLGAGFSEWIALVRYQPFPRLYISAKGIYTQRGTDSAGNMGNNIFNAYNTRVRNEGFSLTPGDRMTGIYADLNVNYEIRPNLFLEAGATHLRRSFASGAVLPSATIVYGGLRWNITRRQFDYY